MVLLCSTPPAPLPVDVAATRPLVQELATSAAAREHVRALASTTYGRCVLGLAGFLTFATEHMAAFVKRMNGDVSSKDLAITHEMLLLLAKTVVDEDNATFIARIGAHPLLMRLMEHENEDIQEAAAEVVTSCTSSPSAITFPHRVRQVGEVERLWPRGVPLPFDTRDNAPKNEDGTQGTLEVLIRQVPTRMTGQRKTGYLLWGAAFVLARWIHMHRELFEGKSVIEVGSGLGLGGIVAARYATHTTLTDYQSDTCTALEYNVQLNKPFTHEFDPTKPEVKVAHLDWDLTESIEAVPKAEVVIASDIICEPSTAEGFLRVVRHHVIGNPNGVAYLMNANSHSRFGVIHLHALLAASTDLSYSITPVAELADAAELLETVSDAQELSYEFYEIRAASH
ncbi:putative methyltransferase [Phytophthora cinnamomi]|uniref:putative methyltransferase n=1 Tax=Phytophthora cinnamomi TaxID=4785 RepID=UPI003559DF00|nr:putative methyltransferase [Phytophthora cinnamomi]